MGSGYIKCGPPELSLPKVIPACYPTKKASSKSKKLVELDPGRKGLSFPLEAGILPKKSSDLAPLCDFVFQAFKYKPTKRKKVELLLLLFPLMKTEKVTRLCKELQEVLGCLHVTAAPQPILTWSYSGKKSSIVVDIGYTASFVTPIYQGFLMNEYIKPLITGSFFVSAALRRLMLKMAENSSAAEHDILAELAMDGEAIDFIKKTLCHVIKDPDKTLSTSKESRYRRGDIDISLGNIPAEAIEVLFHPPLLEVGDLGIVNAIADILNNVDPTVRAELASSIVLAGGGAILPGLSQRIHNDLKKQMPYLDIGVYDLEKPMYSAWLGAAML
jgi:actin-related protein